MFAQTPVGQRRKAVSSALTGKLFDAEGEPLYACGSNKGARCYRYYVSRKLIQGSPRTTNTGWRLPALQIEPAVAAAIRRMLGDRPAIAATLQEAGVPIDELQPALAAADTEREQLEHSSEEADSLRTLINRVQLEKGGIRVSLNLGILIANQSDLPDSANLTLTWFLPIEMKRRGVELRLVIEGERAPASAPDPSLLKAIARGHRWFGELASGTVASIAEIAGREKISESYVKRLIPLAFLAPEIIRSVCHGSQPPGLTAEALKRAVPLPLEWENQRRILGCG